MQRFLLTHVLQYLCVITEPLKIALVVEAKAWKTAYGRSLNSRYRASMDHIVQFVAEYDKKLARPVQVGVTNTCIWLNCYC